MVNSVTTHYEWRNRTNPEVVTTSQDGLRAIMNEKPTAAAQVTGDSTTFTTKKKSGFFSKVFKLAVLVAAIGAALTILRRKGYIPSEVTKEGNNIIMRGLSHAANWTDTVAWNWISTKAVNGWKQVKGVWTKATQEAENAA